MPTYVASAAVLHRLRTIQVPSPACAARVVQVLLHQPPRLGESSAAPAHFCSEEGRRIQKAPSKERVYLKQLHKTRLPTHSAVFLYVSVPPHSSKQRACRVPRHARTLKGCVCLLKYSHTNQDQMPLHTHTNQQCCCAAKASTTDHADPTPCNPTRAQACRKRAFSGR